MRARASSNLIRLAGALSVLTATPSLWADDAPDVVVTEARKQLRRATRDDTAAASVVPREVLARAGGSVADALRTQPGVVVQSTGSAADLTTVLVRGATSAELPVYVAGVRINDDLTGTADLSTVPAWMLSRVEIYRSNAPLDADRSGIGGAMYLEPRRPRGTTAAVEGTVGSYGFRSLSGLAGTGDERASVLVAVRSERADNDYPYVNDQGTRFVSGDDRVTQRANADSHTTDAWAISRVSIRDSSWSLVVNGFSREQGIPGLGLTPAFAARSRTERALGGLHGTMKCGDTCEAILGLSLLETRRELSDPRLELGLGSDQLAIEGRRVEPSARVGFDVVDGLRVVTAADIASESLTIAYAGSRAESDRTTLRGALQAIAKPFRLLTIGARGGLEDDATVSNGVSSSVAPTSFRLSERFGDDHLALLSNLSRAERVPTLGELFGQSAVIRGNDALLPEEALSFDLGGRLSQPFSATKRASRIEVDAFVFTREVTDLIAFRRASIGYVRPYNVGKAHLGGAEMDIAATLFARVLLRESLTLEDARDVTPGRQQLNDILPFRPRLVSSSRAAVLLADVFDLEAADVGIDIVHEASRFADSAGLDVIPQSTTLDLDATAATQIAGLLVTARGRVSNLTNATVFDIVGYPLPPRRAFVSLEVSF